MKNDLAFRLFVWQTWAITSCLVTLLVSWVFVSSSNEYIHTNRQLREEIMSLAAQLDKAVVQRDEARANLKSLK